MAIDTVRLRGEHDSLAVIADELRQLVASTVPQGASVSALRWRLCRELLTHLAMEDQQLYPYLLTSADTSIVALARQFMEEMGGLATGFKNYIETWPTQRISTDWDAFCTETIAILDALEKRIVKENTMLYPMVERRNASAA